MPMSRGQRGPKKRKLYGLLEKMHIDLNPEVDSNPAEVLDFIRNENYEYNRSRENENCLCVNLSSHTMWNSYLH